MTCIVHLSDLHFGRDRPDLVQPLVALIADIAPDLVVISGDLTQRARISQFQDAKRFIDQLTSPVLAVPGNHDTPLDNLWLRLFRPFGRYKKWICANLEPDFRDDTSHVVGVNTVNRFAWQRGRLSRRTIGRICAAFADGNPQDMRFVVVHHPLEHLLETDKRLMSGAKRAVRSFAACGADVVLCGHLHHTIAAPTTAEPGILLVQAGTGLSTRLRGQVNMFNVLRTDGRALSIENWQASENPKFVLASRVHFVQEDRGWVKVYKT